MSPEEGVLDIPIVTIYSLNEAEKPVIPAFLPHFLS